ncbi:hypothetical protein Tco_1007557 [Tanacetum coccineum]
MIQRRFHEGMSLIFMIKNLYVPFGIPFDPKWFYKDGAYTKNCEGQDMAPLPPKDQRHLWLRYEGQDYTDVVVHDYEDTLGMIFGRRVNRVHVLDFEGLTDETRQALTDRLRMVHTRVEGQLGELRRQMSWRQFILAMGLHTAEEMETDGFRVYWTDSSREIATKADLSDYWSRIASDGDFLGVAPEKVTATNLFYLRSMDEGATVNVPYFLARYLFKYVEGRKQGARMFGGQFVSCLAKHFRLLTEERFRGLTVAWVARGPERQQVTAAGATQAHQEISKGVSRLIRVGSHSR